MNRIILIAACLLAAEMCMASGLFGGPPEPGKMPTRFVRFDGLDDGPCFWNGPPLLFGRLAGVTVILGLFADSCG
jgi:hypothetical protein